MENKELIRLMQVLDKRINTINIYLENAKKTTNLIYIIEKDFAHVITAWADLRDEVKKIIKE